MRIKPRHVILGAIFILYFAMRLYFSLQSDYFNDDSSYLALRQIEHIAQTGKPIINDQLSFGGRVYALMPIYYYLLAAFTLVWPEIIIIKIINNFFASTIIIAVYLVCSSIVKNRKVSLLSALISGMIPIYISETLNNISIYSLLIPGSFFLLYLFIEIRKNRQLIDHITFLTILIVLSTSSSFLILLGLIIFLAISYSEKIDIEKIHLEYLAFFTFFLLWVNFLIYKNAFQRHGFAIIWGNAPSSVLSQYFSSIDLFGAMASIGILPFIFGIYTIYNYLMKKKDKDILVFISLFLAASLLFWFKLIPANLALVFLGSTLAILFGQSATDFFSSLKKTKLEPYGDKLFYILIFLVIITEVVPGVYSMINNSEKPLTQDYISGFTYLRDNSDTGSVVLSVPEEGNLVSYFGKRKNVVDSSFMLIDDPDTILEDIKKVYTQKFRVEALRTIEKYNIDYVIYSYKTRKDYNTTSFPYESDKCFTAMFMNDDVEIYKINKDICELKSI